MRPVELYHGGIQSAVLVNERNFQKRRLRKVNILRPAIGHGKFHVPVVQKNTVRRWNRRNRQIVSDQAGIQKIHHQRFFAGRKIIPVQSGRSGIIQVIALAEQALLRVKSAGQIPAVSEHFRRTVDFRQRTEVPRVHRSVRRGDQFLDPIVRSNVEIEPEMFIQNHDFGVIDEVQSAVPVRCHAADREIPLCRREHRRNFFGNRHRSAVRTVHPRVGFGCLLLPVELRTDIIQSFFLNQSAGQTQQDIFLQPDRRFPDNFSGFFQYGENRLSFPLAQQGQRMV